MNQFTYVPTSTNNDGDGSTLYVPQLDIATGWFAISDPWNSFHIHEQQEEENTEQFIEQKGDLRWEREQLSQNKHLQIQRAP